MTQIQRQAQITAEWAGCRLDQAAAGLWPEFSRSRIRRWIEADQLLLDGSPVIPRSKVAIGQTISLDAELATVGALQPEPIPLTVVHQDSALLVIDKPAGMVVHPGAGNPGRTLQNALLHYDPVLAQLPRAGIVHRLDKDTSGLLLVARSLQAHGALVAQLQRREISRTYQAVCQGVLVGGGTVDAAIGRHPRDRLRMAVVMTGGREARSHYRVVQRFRAQTWVQVELDTGRTHQIRVHMAHIRHPLVGDSVYGGRPRLPGAPSAELTQQLQSFSRQALHASRLVLRHPTKGEPLSVNSPLPADMQALLDALQRDASAPDTQRPG